MSGPVFATNGDTLAERRVQRAIEETWGCTLHRMPPMDPLDYYAAKDGRTVAYVEIKSRTHPHDRFPTVLLSHRKYLWLMSAYLLFGVPALYVIEWADGVIRWVDVATVTPTRHDLRIEGRPPRNGSTNDLEPIIHVPVDTMRALR